MNIDAQEIMNISFINIRYIQVYKMNREISIWTIEERLFDT